jgi:hypothetical protein
MSTVIFGTHLTVGCSITSYYCSHFLFSPIALVHPFPILSPIFETIPSHLVLLQHTDTQCVVYSGPDTRYTGRQICFGFNEETLTIYDVTDKTSPQVIFRLGYTGSAYTHQGWLNEEMTSLLLNDELDEQRGTTNGRRTRTYVWDITSLTAARETGRFDHPETSIDHNLYVWGAIHRKGWGGSPPMATPPKSKYAYLSNYCSGLRIVDLTNQNQGIITQAGFFDSEPDCNSAIFEGTWSNYMHPSGVIAVPNIGTGVYFVQFNDTF